MMSHKKKADEILRLLTLCPFEMTEAQAIITQHLTTPDWEKMMTDIWNRRQDAMQRRLSEAGCWEALFEVCMGSSHHSRGDFLAAIGRYSSGMPRFKSESLHYCHAVALIALGQAHQALRASDEALRWYREAKEIVQGVQRDCKVQTGCKGDACRQLVAAITARIREVEEPNKLHFIPLPLHEKVAAGTPLYMPGDGAEDAERDVVILGTTEYRLLALETREPIRRSFPADERFFPVGVKGTSMIDAGIRDGDLVFVKRHEEEPPSRAIAVFVEEDSGPIIKRFSRSGDRVYLVSANPNIPPRVASPTLRSVGLVVAILEEIK